MTSSHDSSSNAAACFVSSPTDSRQFGGVEGPVAVVMDPSAGFPVELEERVVTLGGAGRLHHPQQVVGERDRLVERRVLRRIVLELEADRAPRHLDVAVRYDFVDHPAGGRPAEWACGIDPEFDVHQCGAFQCSCRLGDGGSWSTGDGGDGDADAADLVATEALDLGVEVQAGRASPCAAGRAR